MVVNGRNTFNFMCRPYVFSFLSRETKVSPTTPSFICVFNKGRGRILLLGRIYRDKSKKQNERIT